MYYQDNHIKIFNKDCRDMSELADNSVQCVVTSPPYWGLRKYSGEQELIWGDNNCEHQWVNEARGRKRAINYEQSTLHGAQTSPIYREHLETLADTIQYTGFCSLCGAWKGAYGLEPTPEMYIQHTIEILREIGRVLRKDGVVFWDIGDSYYGSGQGASKNPDVLAKAKEVYNIGEKHHKASNTLKPKDLCLIPFRVAIAAQEDGWWVRSVIIWSKNNPMPESVTDRPTESHEYILMLTKSKNYYWDADAVREDARDWGIRDRSNFRGGTKDPLLKHHGLTNSNNAETGRNIRTVWEFPTQPYPEAHFAVFPEKLPEICIKAATPEEGCCSKCGSPWERVIEKDRQATRPGYTQKTDDYNYDTERHCTTTKTLGWQPTCKCNADKVPSVALDPFMGAGTTLWVAKKLNRQAMGYEISEEYCELALKRNRQQVLI